MRLGRLILLLSAGIASLYGQGTTGTLVGTVKDSSGAIVAGAIVTVTNQGTNTTRNTTTTQDGEYSVPLLPPGTYDVAIKQPGFRDELYKNVTLDVDQTARVDSTLSVGTQAETVNVDAAAPLINTDTSTIGQVISDQSVNELPLNN